MIVLHPPREGVPGAAGRSNDNSVVLKVTKGAISFLLCGDLEEQGVPWVLQWGDAVRATILKVPHHGSALGAATQAFFERVHPEVSIISVGRVHHLPSSEVVNALARVGTQLYLTRRDGAVTVRTDGTQLFVRTFKE
jgi:competence protein ComEC